LKAVSRKRKNLELVSSLQNAPMTNWKKMDYSFRIR